MEVELSDVLFEQLLADWAAHGGDHGKPFRTLHDMSSTSLIKDLTRAMRKAVFSQRVLSKPGRKETASSPTVKPDYVGPPGDS